VLPLLRAVHPGADEAILRHARLAREDDEVLSGYAGQILSREAAREPEGLRISVAQIADAPAPIRRRLYLAAWKAVGCSPSGLEMAHLDAVDSLLAPGRAHRLAPVPGSGVFARSYDDLWVLAPGFLDPEPVSLQLDAPGRAPCRSLGGTVEWGADPPPSTPRIGVPGGRGCGGVRVRTWRAGDRIDPGSGALRKVKDLLMEARVPLWRRRRSLVVSDAAGTLGLLSPDRGWGSRSAEAGWVWLSTDRREATPGERTDREKVWSPPNSCDN
jgi:tRNA(Ile)-lysidine synthetase-like protein